MNKSVNKCNRILLIEDDEDIREALQTTLEMKGYEVSTACDGRQGLEALAKMKQPSLILLDLMMPIMDGWEFINYVSADNVLATIPVVVITANADSVGHVPHAKRVIKKPVDLDFLDEALRECCL